MLFSNEVNFLLNKRSDFLRFMCFMLGFKLMMKNDDYDDVTDSNNSS